jgi:hypothetical protein
MCFFLHVIFTCGFFLKGNLSWCFNNTEVQKSTRKHLHLSITNFVRGVVVNSERCWAFEIWRERHHCSGIFTEHRHTNTSHLKNNTQLPWWRSKKLHKCFSIQTWLSRRKRRLTLDWKSNKMDSIGESSILIFKFFAGVLFGQNGIVWIRNTSKTSHLKDKAF